MKKDFDEPHKSEKLKDERLDQAIEATAVQLGKSKEEVGAAFGQAMCNVAAKFGFSAHGISKEEYQERFSINENQILDQIEQNKPKLN